MKKLVMTLLLSVIPTAAMAVDTCWNDSECPPDKVCVCPHSSRTGNCDTIGVCINRDDAPHAAAGFNLPRPGDPVTYSGRLTAPAQLPD